MMMLIEVYRVFMVDFRSGSFVWMDLFRKLVLIMIWYGGISEVLNLKNMDDGVCCVMVSFVLFSL